VEREDGAAVGALASYASVPAVALALKPPSLTHEQAAAVPLVGVTALKGLRDHGRIKAGQKVLITGASGGVGSFAVQIARAFGADVTAVCSTRNADFVRSIGADHVIDYTREDYLQGGHRYDLILDNVGNHSVLQCRRALTPGGTLLPNSGAGGRWLDGLPRVAGAFALSPFVRQRLRPFVPAGTGADLAVLTELIEAGKVTPVIDRTYPLSETAAALAYYGQGHTRGKVVITT
jgi:NADPH:quinone reductase-like Zn-dependent oxidoreductase